MAIPHHLIYIFIALALLFVHYAINRRDKIYYTDIIAGFFSTIFWLLISYSFIIGIQTDYATYQGWEFALVFASIGLINGLYMFFRLWDVNSGNGLYPERR